MINLVPGILHSYIQAKRVWRKDHLSYFQTQQYVGQEVRNHNKREDRIQPIWIKEYFLYIQWYRKARKNGLSSSLVKAAGMVALALGEIGRWDAYHAANKKSLVVTYCDGMLSDYYITALADADSVSTATVQHGVFANDSMGI